MTPQQRRILIVDDNRAIHADFRKILQRPDHAELGDLEAELFGEERSVAIGFVLTSAYQGAEGIELVRAARAAGTPFALAIVDMRMPPGLDGIQTISAMWEADPDLQVVICTAFSDTSWNEILRRFGATDRLLILKKPFDLVEVGQLAIALTEKWMLAQQARTQLAAVAKGRLELAASLALATAVQEATVDGMLVVRPDRKVETANRRFLEMWRIPPELYATRDDDALLRHVLDQLTDPDGFLERIRTLYDRPEETATDELALRDGRFLERCTAPVRGEDGTIHGRLWCFRDISERRKLETERAVVAERMASMGRLAASVGHEINNPLMYAFGNVENLVDACDGDAMPSRDELLAALHDTHDGLARIRVIVRDLQTLARSDEAEVELSLEQVVEQAIQIAANEVRHRAPIVRNFQPTPPVRGNRTRLGQVVLNLLINAAQAIPDGNFANNRIEIALFSTPAHVVLEVTDTGCGIAQENLERIFDPFFTTKDVGAGTGLGLAISNEIIKRHKGEISVRSTPGAGTTMRVSLPHVTDTSVTVPIPRVVQSSRRAKVLVIDDEPLVTRSIERGLAAHHQVVVAPQARDALARIERGETFDVILCDLMMPDLSGIDVHEWLQRQYPSLVPRVVFMSGGAFTSRAKEFLSEVPNEFIAKPFSTTEILRLLDRHLHA